MYYPRGKNVQSNNLNYQPNTNQTSDYNLKPNTTRPYPYPQSGLAFGQQPSIYTESRIDTTRNGGMMNQSVSDARKIQTQHSKSPNGFGYQGQNEIQNNYMNYQPQYQQFS